MHKKVLSNTINSFLIYSAETNSKIKGHNSIKNWWILSSLELDLYFMIILHVYMKCESNTGIYIQRYCTETNHWTGRDVLQRHTDKGDTKCPPPHPAPPHHTYENGTAAVNVLKFETLVACQKAYRRTVQTQIRLLLKKQSDQGHPCLLFWQAFCEFQPWKPQFFKKKNSFRTFTASREEWPESAYAFLFRVSKQQRL